MSDTPETDNNAYECIQRFEMGGSTTAEKQSCKQGDCVSADFARKLERERDEARKERERAETKCAAEYEAHKMTQSERDALRAEADQLKADKARLDWLEKRESMEGFTRAAIDAAMKVEL